MHSPIDPGDKVREAIKLLAQPYDSEENRKETMLHYMAQQQGLAMLLYSLYPKGVPQRVRYARLVREVYALLVLALTLTVLWFARFAPLGIAEILAHRSLAVGFFSMMGIVTLMWALAFTRIRRARAALLHAAYEVLRHLADKARKEQLDSNATDP